MAASFEIGVKITTDARASVAAFTDLKRSLAQSEVALKAAREEANRLAAQLKAAGGADPGLARAFEAARTHAARLKAEVASGRVRLEEMRRSLAASGMDTRNLAESMQRARQQAEALAQAEEKNWKRWVAEVSR